MVQCITDTINLFFTITLVSQAGEVRPNRGAGRREIGHGNLALERALKNTICRRG